MKKLLMAMMVVIVTVTVGVSSAEAKRLGGGGSFGKQSQGISRQTPTHSPSQAANPSNAARPAAPAPAAANAARPASPWKGILGGALLGLGLGALLSHLGLSGALASMISSVLMVALLALAAMFIYRMLRRRQDAGSGRPAWAATGAQGAPVAPHIGSALDERSDAQPWALRSAQPAADLANPAPAGVPADFDTAGFLRHAKTYYIRLQAAWDRADVNDLREFCTPQMFAELKMQLQERGVAANVTDVVQLDAELLGIASRDGEYLASVKFSGLIREAEGAPAERFAEIWNLSKPEQGRDGWLLAGIEQLS